MSFSRNANVIVYALLIILGSAVICGCQPKKKDDSISTSTNRYLYIQSGGCFAPTGLTASNASKTVSRINLTTGVLDKTVIDYTANLTDTPVAIADIDSDNMYILIENTGGRRIEVVNKTTGVTSSIYFMNTTALNAVVRTLTFGSDGSFLISKSSAVERFTSSKARLPSSATTFLSATVAPCATSTNAITATAFMNNGNILYAHSFSSASTNNRIGITTGSAAAASTCVQGTASPNTAAFPTAMVYLNNINQLLVAYSSSTLAQNYIWQYGINESTGAITPAASAAYSNPAVINGPTAMAYDSTTGIIYIANGTTVMANSIEAFTYDSTAKTLTRIGTVPFSSPTVNHNCINSMFIGI